MKISKQLLLAVSVMALSAGVSMADDSVQAYAHPTLFGSQSQTLQTVDSDVVVGGKIYKPCQAKTIAKKQNVVEMQSNIHCILHIIDHNKWNYERKL